jgi:hypothetical protein
MTHPADIRWTETVRSAVRQGAPTPPGVVEHAVQFYRTDDFLIRAVVDYLAAGLSIGQPAIVVATEPHRRAIAHALRARSLDPEEILGEREAVWLDARETLSAFMEGGRPNPDLFMSTVGRVFEKLLRKRSYLIVRGYGEMVDLLWKDGNTDGAIAVEELWNELAHQYSFSLLCAYAVDDCLKEAQTEALKRMCGQHSNALPVEPDRDAN